ncbi:MAG: polysaccharide biosynthesis protein, partial [Campylobacterales bacterium]
ILKDYSMSWSKATPKTFLIKSVVYISAFAVYMPFFYGEVHFYMLVSELFTFLFAINFLMYSYSYLINRSSTRKTKSLVIYGAGKAGLKLEEEFKHTPYKLRYFVDDDERLQKRTIDSIKIISKQDLKSRLGEQKYDLLVIAIPSATSKRIKEIYERLHDYFKEIKILPSLDEMLQDRDYTKQLKNVTVEDLLARRPQDLDKKAIASFLKDKVVLVTGAGGSIGSEICRQCVRFGVSKLIMLDHSEYNLYAISEELADADISPILASVVDKQRLEEVFELYSPEIVIHAAAYKHVPLVEENINQAITNNIEGTKNTIDLSIKYDVEKFVLISTDKAVRPTNVMGATKRVCEMYAQSVNTDENTQIVAVRFGNVLGSSGSVIPKFKAQIEAGGPITVTHPEITRYFMLIPEACELVLQAASIGKGGEIFILDMGEPIKILDLAKKMCELSGAQDIEIEFSGLRAGEKLYEELLIDKDSAKTDYDSIMIADIKKQDISTLSKAIDELLASDDKLDLLKKLVPEFTHSVKS